MVTRLSARADTEPGRLPPVAPVPFLAAQLAATQASRTASGVGITLINFNTARQTLRCVESLRASTLAPGWVLVLDNGSGDEDFALLLQQCLALPESEVRIYRSEVNLGFAAGSNFLIDVLLVEPNAQCNYFGLLNNDAVAMPDMVQLLVTALDQSKGKAGMSGGRMHRLAASDEVDTLGITLYASLMPADRKTTDDPYLGPTGGCCLMTRAFVQDVKASSGYCFDERFFCYCEDTDLVLRAVLLGYRPAYVDQLVALHEGQASSRARHNSFITYHGLRNAIWMHWKFIPTSLLIRNCFWLLLAHLLSIARQILSGRLGVLFALYRDAFKQLPAMLEERARFKALTRAAPAVLATSMSSRFYRKGYTAVVIAELRNRFRSNR